MLLAHGVFRGWHRADIGALAYLVEGQADVKTQSLNFIDFTHDDSLFWHVSFPGMKEKNITLIINALRIILAA